MILRASNLAESTTIGTTILDYLPTYDHSTNKYMFKTNKECIGNCEASLGGSENTSLQAQVPKQFTSMGDEKAEDAESLATVSSGNNDNTNSSLDGVETFDELPLPREGAEDDEILVAVISTGSNDTTHNIGDGVEATGGLTQLWTRATFWRKRKQRLSRIYVRLQQLGMNSTMLEVANGDKKTARATCQRKKLQWELNGSNTFITKVDMPGLKEFLQMKS